MRNRKFRTTAGRSLFFLFLIGLSVSWSSGQTSYDPSKTYPVDELREDLQTLWNILDEGHGGLERYTPREVLKQKFDEALSRLTKPLAEIDFYRLLLPLIAEIKDGHTSLRMSVAGRAHLFGRPVFFPFELRFMREKAYLFRNLSSDPNIKEGAEILSIDGVPMPEILQKLLTVVPCDAGILTRRLRLLESPATFGNYFAVMSGPSEKFQVRLRIFPGHEIQDITVSGIKGDDIPMFLQKRYPEAARRKPLYELEFKGTTAILTIRGFGDDQGTGRPAYPQFIRDAFQELAEKKTSNLIIDVRGNGGGADKYGRLLFAHFMDKPFLYYKALELKKDRFDLFQYTNVAGKDALWSGSSIRKNARGWFDVLDHPNVGIMPPEAPLFTGNACILIDGLSFSTTGESTSLFHFHKKAEFVGEECGAGYYGNTSGAMPLATLPHTRLQVRIPLVLYTLAVEGYPKNRGIIPGISVSPTIEDLLAGRDIVLERAMSHLEKKTIQRLLDENRN